MTCHPTQVIGQRLAQRTERPGQEALELVSGSRGHGRKLNALTALENKEAGTIEMFVTLPVFYHGQGFNPAWVVLVDNSAVSKWVLAENTKAVAVEQVTAELSKFRERVQQTIDEMRKEVENG